MKTCKGCGESKELSHFWRCNGTKDGLRSKCKQCTYAENSAWRRKNPQRWVSYTVAWTERNPEKAAAARREYHSSEEYKELVRKSRKAYSQRNPEKNRARTRVRDSVIAGKIVRPSVCSMGGNEGKIEAHHPDYSQPLSVIWCCKGCHMRTFHRKSEAV